MKNNINQKGDQKLKQTMDALNKLMTETTRLRDAIRSTPVKQVDSVHRIHINALTDHVSHVCTELESLTPLKETKTMRYEVATTETIKRTTNRILEADSPEQAKSRAESEKGYISGQGETITAIHHEIVETPLTDTEKLVLELVKATNNMGLGISIRSLIKATAMSINADVDVDRIIKELNKCL